MRYTPLHARHVSLGATMNDGAWHGWDMPLYYSSVADEYRAVRETATVVDMSCMGKLDVKGSDATRFLQWALANDLERLPVERALLSCLLNRSGGIIDSVVVVRLAERHYWLVTATGQRQKVFRWLTDLARDYEVGITDITAAVAIFSVQGPASAPVLEQLTRISLSPSRVQYFDFVPVRVGATSAWLLKISFSGSRGYELYCPAEEAPEVWDILLEAGRASGVVPGGWGHLRPARTEKMHLAYGIDYDEGNNPFETGLDRFVSFQKPDFVGRNALDRIRNAGASQKVVGLDLEGSTVPKGGEQVSVGGEIAGRVTTGAWSFHLGRPIALAMLSTAAAVAGGTVDVQMAEGPVRGRVVKKPFFDPSGSLMRS